MLYDIVVKIGETIVFETQLFNARIYSDQINFLIVQKNECDSVVVASFPAPTHSVTCLPVILLQ